MRKLIWVGTALVLAGAIATAAEARKRGGSSSEYYEWQSEHRGPAHGYSGWVPGGRRSLYCDYQRIPNRECTVTASGKRRCKATSWTLKQYCY
ncbi:MAG: hypothetical protein ACKVP3_26670 [Hyphomicrobiaceae bacterium]